MFQNSYSPWPGVPNYSNYQKEPIQCLLDAFQIEDNYQLQQDLGIPPVKDYKEAFRILEQKENNREVKVKMESLLMRFKGRVDLQETIDNDIPVVISHDIFFLPMINWVTNLTYLLIQLNTITSEAFNLHIHQIAEEIKIKDKINEETLQENEVLEVIRYLSTYQRQYTFYIHKNKFPDPNPFKTYGQGKIFIHLFMWRNFLHPVQMPYDSWFTLNESFKRTGIRFVSIEYEEIALKKYQILQTKNYRSFGEEGILLLNSGRYIEEQDQIQKKVQLENKEFRQISSLQLSQISNQSKSEKKSEKELKRLQDHQEENLVFQMYLQFLNKVKKYGNYNYSYEAIDQRKFQQDTIAFKFKNKVMFFINDQSKTLFGYNIETVVAHKDNLELHIQQVIETLLYKTPTISSVQSEIQSELDRNSEVRSEYSLNTQFNRKCQINQGFY